MQIEVIIEKKSHKLDAEEGKTILETLQEHGIHVLTAPCGGRGRCGKCTVEVEHMGEVLACMTKVTDGKENAEAGKRRSKKGKMHPE